MSDKKQLHLTGALVFAALAGLSLLALLMTGVFLSINLPIFKDILLAHLGFLGLSFLLLLHGFSKVMLQGKVWYAAVLLPWVAVLIILAELPPTNTHALFDSLGLAKSWNDADRIFQLKNHPAASLPSLSAVAYTGLISELLGEFCGLYTLTYLLMTVFLTSIFLYNKSGSAHIAGSSAFTLLALPFAAQSGIVPGSATLASFYAAQACFAAVSWSNEERGFFNLVIAGISLGLVLGTGPCGVIFAATFLPAFFILAVLRKRSSGDILFSLITCFTIALCCFLPWMFRSFYWTLNPFQGIFRISFSYSLPLDLLAPILSPAILSLALFRKAWVVFFWIISAALGGGLVYYGGSDAAFAMIYFTAVSLAGIGLFVIAKYMPKNAKLAPAWVAMLAALLVGGSKLAETWERTEAAWFLAEPSKRDDFLRAELPGYHIVEIVNRSTTTNDRTAFLVKSPPLFYLDVPVSESAEIADLAEEIVREASVTPRFKLIVTDQSDIQMSVQNGSLSPELVKQLSTYLSEKYILSSNDRNVSLWKRKDQPA